MTPETLSIGTLLQGLTLAAVLWLFRSVQQLREDHVQLTTTLTGANGDNGINSEVKALRKRSHDQGDALHAVLGRMDVHELRLDTLDRRVGPEDRRMT